MSAVRYRPHGTCSLTLGESPGGTIYVKSNPNASGPKGAFPVRWNGFQTLSRSKLIPYTQKAKLIVTGVTAGDVICSEWIDLKKNQFCLGLLIQIGAAHEFAAWGLVSDENNLPIIITEGGPRLTIVDEKSKPSIRPFTRKTA